MTEFKCPKCSAIFYTRDDLRRHIYVHHLPGGGEAEVDSLVQQAESAAEPGEPSAATDDDKASDKEWVVVRNPQGRCAVVGVAQPLPPGWMKINGPTTRDVADQWRAGHCDLGSETNKCSS